MSAINTAWSHWQKYVANNLMDRSTANGGKASTLNVQGLKAPVSSVRPKKPASLKAVIWPFNVVLVVLFQTERNKAESLRTELYNSLDSMMPNCCFVVCQ